MYLNLGDENTELLKDNSKKCSTGENRCQRYLETKLQSINFLLKQFNLQSNGISSKAKVRLV